MKFELSGGGSNAALAERARLTIVVEIAFVILDDGYDEKEDSAVILITLFF